MPNEIQTVTVSGFVGAPAFAFFAVDWLDYISSGVSCGASVQSLDTQTAETAADAFETEFNTNADINGDATKTISVTGAVDGTSLVLTIEFDGAGIADTNVDPGIPSDWDDVGMPVIATVQEGGDVPSPPSSVAAFGSGGGFGSMSHGNGFN